MPLCFLRLCSLCSSLRHVAEQYCSKLPIKCRCPSSEPGMYGLMRNIVILVLHALHLRKWSFLMDYKKQSILNAENIDQTSNFQGRNKNPPWLAHSSVITSFGLMWFLSVVCASIFILPTHTLANNIRRWVFSSVNKKLERMFLLNSSSKVPHSTCFNSVCGLLAYNPFNVN